MIDLDLYILEKLVIDKDSTVKKIYAYQCVIDDITKLCEPKYKKIIGQFLKGKIPNSGMDIYLKNNKKYLHIFRYTDTSMITVSVVYNDSADWPNEKDWSNAKRKEDLYKKEVMDSLWSKFYDFLKNSFDL